MDQYDKLHGGLIECFPFTHGRVSEALRDGFNTVYGLYVERCGRAGRPEELRISMFSGVTRMIADALKERLR